MGRIFPEDYKRKQHEFRPRSTNQQVVFRVQFLAGLGSTKGQGKKMMEYLF